MKKNRKLQIILPLVGAVLVSALVSGTVVKAENGQSVLSQGIELLKLLLQADERKVDLPTGELSVGAQAATSDDITIGKFNALALVTDPTTSANSAYQNFELQFVGLVGDVGSATNTPLSVRNTWAQTVYAKDAFVQCVGSASTTNANIRAWAGTSTVPSSPDILGTATATLTNQFGSLLGGVALRNSISGEIVTSAPTSTVVGTGGATNLHTGIVPVLAGQYLNIFVRTDEARNMVTSTIWRGCTDIVAGVTIEGHSTSTVQY